MHSLSSARQSEVKAWEEEIIACEHTLLVKQLVSGPIPAEGELIDLYRAAARSYCKRRARALHFLRANV